MKKKQWIVLLSLLLCSMTFSFTTIQAAKKQNSKKDRITVIREQLFNPNSKKVLVASHRGDWRNYAENTIEGIEGAIAMGVDIVEMDLHKTKDGQIILMHDPTVNRTTTGKGNISDFTLEEIKNMKVKNGCAIRTKYKVPTLEEALLACKGKIMVNLDKAFDMFDDVYKIMEKTGTTNQIIMKSEKSYEEVQRDFGKYLDKVIYMPIVRVHKKGGVEKVREFEEKMHPVAFEILYEDDNDPSIQQVKEILKGKSQIWYNTLWKYMSGPHDDDQAMENPDSSYGYLINNGDGRIIQTDRPAYLINYLKKNKLYVK